MTPWIRAVRAAGLTVALVWAGGSGTAYGVQDPPSPSASAAAPVPSRAGSAAGEGRERPGRPGVSAPEEAVPSAPATGTPPGEPVPEASREPVPAQQAVEAEPVLEVRRRTAA
ncbi:hypothetical protein [Streptomyces sp. NPDC003832]